MQMPSSQLTVPIRLRAVVGVSLFIGWLVGIISLAVVLTVMPSDPPAGNSEDEGAEKTSGLASATGFVISSEGHILTNAHVVEECDKVTARIHGKDRELDLLGTDYFNDLAVLTPRLSKWQHFATLRDRDVKLAESVLVAGYPLRDKLSDTIHITTGEVSNLAGAYGDSTLFQTSAPLQPGNSGSPVLDREGNVVGIATAKLAPDEDGSDDPPPDNVAFAVRASTIKAFLEIHSIEFAAGVHRQERKPEEIAAEANCYTLVLTCVR